MIDPSSDNTGSSPRSWDRGTGQEISAPGRPTPERRERNKSIATVWMICGGAVMVACGVAMRVGQLLPILILCLVGFVAGVAAFIHGRSIGNR